MEELKEETEKVKTSVTKIITDASDIIMDRLKNPYITAFAISWIAFNWKPIALFIFSKGTTEHKINQISKHYSNEWYYLYYPFICAIIFLFIIPYLNQLNEWFVSFSIEKRADYIKNQMVKKIGRDTDIAKELEKKEKAIKDAREGAQHNELVNTLNKTISDLEKTLHEERMKNSEDVNKRNEEYNQQAQLYEKQIADLISRSNKDNEIITTQNLELTTRNNEIRKELLEKNHEIESLKFHHQTQKNTKSRILEPNGAGWILEYHNPNNEIFYYSLSNKQFITKDDFFELSHNIVNTIDQESIVGETIDKMKNRLSRDELAELENKQS